MNPAVTIGLALVAIGILSHAIDVANHRGAATKVQRALRWLALIGVWWLLLNRYRGSAAILLFPGGPIALGVGMWFARRSMVAAARRKA